MITDMELRMVTDAPMILEFILGEAANGIIVGK